jgi:1-acyl-sn-glycerol-3-phosphate acyltransferase
MERSGRALKSGASLLFFPEGHRSRTGRLQPLRKGAFLIAARNGVPVVPVTIAGTEYLGGYRSRLLNPCRITLTFHPPLRAQGLNFQAILALRHQVEDCYRESVYRF